MKQLSEGKEGGGGGGGDEFVLKMGASRKNYTHSLSHTHTHTKDELYSWSKDRRAGVCLSPLLKEGAQKR